LQEAGYKVVGKTTGTSARLLLWNRSREISIKRKPIGANIGEQIEILHKAAALGAEALVCECMAINPEYQEVSHKEILKSNITVITNVLEDHLDEMGPTTEQIAWAFAKTIPHNGILVITDGPFEEYFRNIAKERGTKVVCVPKATIDRQYMKKFPYMVFRNNCAIGIGVAEALGIDRETAMRGMLKANPDPGTAQIVEVDRFGKKCWLVNAFAANEPESSLEIWNNLENVENISTKNAVVVMCCRDDRVDRTKQFISSFLSFIKAKSILVIGTGTIELLKAYEDNKFSKIDDCIDLTNCDSQDIINSLGEEIDDNVVFCVGNIHGVAEEFLKEFANISI
jgi:poly-gamma-glutamate synthase PgsB/CapB